MAQIIGKLANSLATVVNENNVGLAHLNVDFSLVKLEAPPQFRMLETSLSARRQFNAEAGSHHRTARILGALFAELVPPIDKLVQAFGSRISEIMALPGANPSGSAKHGAFKDFVGADATSIWASATSGKPALGILLLACILARKFEDAKISIALWVEIVEIRSREILANSVASGFSNNEAVTAAQLKVSREDLAAFDVSVRAWLNTSDRYMKKKHMQLALIVNNLNTTQVSGGISTYEKITNAWIAAMNGFESILNGRPQNVSDSSLLLALSAWHLYPNLIVLSTETKIVNFDDHLIPATAAITVGVQCHENDEQSLGFKWSLALSHLKFYGEPVDVKSSHDNVRITILDLFLIAMGTLSVRWKLSISELTTFAACLSRIWDLIQSKRDAGKQWCPRIDWLRGLAEASSQFLAHSGKGQRELEKFIKYGRRNARTLLGPCSGEDDVPFFGLCNYSVMSVIHQSPGKERDIAYIRSAVSNLGGGTGDSIIVYNQYYKKCAFMIFATTVPHSRSLLKRDSKGERKVEASHCRWVIITDSWMEEEELSGLSEHLNLPTNEEVHFVQQIDADTTDREWVHSRIEHGFRSFTWVSPAQIYTFSRCDADTPRSKTCLCFHEDPTVAQSRRQSHLLIFQSFERVVNETAGASSTTSSRMEFPAADHDLTHWPPKEPDLPEAVFDCVCGDPSTLALYAVRKSTPASVADCRSQPSDAMQGDVSGSMLARFRMATERLLSPESLLEMLNQIKAGSQDADNLAQRLLDVIEKPHRRPSKHHMTGAMFDKAWFVNMQSLNVGQGGIPKEVWESLDALRLVYELYSQFPTATFPIRIVQSCFRTYEQKMYEKHVYASSGHSQKTRETFPPPLVSLTQRTTSQAINLLCMMESGGSLSWSAGGLEQAFAIASGDSLFVSKRMLTDPSIPTLPTDFVKLTGNLGVPGISVMVSPSILKVRPKTENFKIIEHAPYDFRREDNFRGISLHLSLTGASLPIRTNGVGLIDQDVFIREAYVSVRDCGQWIADIDIMAAWRANPILLTGGCTCERKTKEVTWKLASIDNFDELLDPPEESAVFRAHANWAARLSALCILRQRLENIDCALIDQNLQCWQCLETDYQDSFKERCAQKNVEVRDEDGGPDMDTYADLYEKLSRKPHHRLPDDFMSNHQIVLID